MALRQHLLKRRYHLQKLHFTTIAATTTPAPTGWLSKDPQSYEAKPDVKVAQALRQVVEELQSSKKENNPFFLEQQTQFQQWWQENLQVGEEPQHLSEEKFDDTITTIVQKLEGLQEQSLGKTSTVPKIIQPTTTDEAKQRAASGLQFKLAKFDCEELIGKFDSFEKNDQGEIDIHHVKDAITAYISGNTSDRLRYKFQLYADEDGQLSQEKSVELLKAVVESDTAALKFLVDDYCSEFSKKHKKSFAKECTNQDWNLKIQEKIRCVHHFADKPDESTSINFEAFVKSQQAEFPELSDLLKRYSASFHDETVEAHVRRAKKWRKIGLSVLFTFVIGTADYFVIIA